MTTAAAGVGLVGYWGFRAYQSHSAAASESGKIRGGSANAAPDGNASASFFQRWSEGEGSLVDAAKGLASSFRVQGRSAAE